MNAARRAILIPIAAAIAGGADRRSISDPDLRAIERQVFLLVNEERRKLGIGALEWDPELAAAARRHSYNMAARWFFSHTDPERGGLDRRLRSEGIRWRRCAENIFREQGHADPAAKAVEKWGDSPGHRANMLNRFLSRTGVGAYMRIDGTLFVTQEFVTP